MKTFIKKIHIPTSPIASAKPKKNANWPLKSWNSNPYYNNLHKKCYYFNEQYKNYFKITKSLSYKCLSFAKRFFKYCIFNHWQ